MSRPTSTNKVYCHNEGRVSTHTCYLLLSKILSTHEHQSPLPATLLHYSFTTCANGLGMLIVDNSLYTLTQRGLRTINIAELFAHVSKIK